MRLFLLTFHILISNPDLAHTTFVPFNFIPTFFRTRWAKLREQSLFIRWRGWNILGGGQNILNCGFFKAESASSDHKPSTSQVPLLNKQTDDTSTDIALCIFCGKQTFKKDRKLHKISLEK
jgi:hypothetical protein